MYVAARSENTASIKEIAEHYGISRDHLVKVVHRLSQLGYIETTKGKGGDIKIAKGKENLRLGDLIKQLEPNMNMVECFDVKTNTCWITGLFQLKHYIFKATQNFINTMNKYLMNPLKLNSKKNILPNSLLS